MALTPLDIQKVAFPRKLWGYDPVEVENFLSLVAEELTAHLSEVEKLERENRYYKQRWQESQQRENQLQATLVRAHKVSEELAANAKREAELIVREAETTADRIVSRAMEEAARTEANISQLRTMRRELYLKFKNTLEFFERVLKAELAKDDSTAMVRTLSRPRQKGGEGSGQGGQV